MKCREEDKEIEAFRCKLDPAYHSTYSYSRKPIHCDIIRKLLTKSGLRPKSDFTSTPKAILVTGPIGAGKSYLLSWMQQCALVPSMKSYVMVNMDEIRDMLPESKFYSTCLPEEYGEMTQREAGTIAELLVLVALGRGFNVCIDSAMIDLQWQEEYIMQLRQAHPDIKIAMIHVTASKDVIEARIKQRNAHGHRFVPSSIMRSYFQQLHDYRVFLRDRSWLDFFISVDTSHGRAGFQVGDGQRIQFPITWTWENVKEEFDTWDREAHFHAEDDLFIIPKTSKDFVSLDSIAVTLPKIKPSPELVTPSGSKGKIPTNFPPIQTPPSSFERLKPHMKPFARSFPETNLPCSPHYKRGSLSFQDFETNNDGNNNHPIVSRSLRNILTDDLDQAEDDFETTRSKLLPSSQLPADYSLSYQQAVSIRRNIRPALERMQAIKTIEPLSSARTSNSRYTSSSSAGSLNSTSTTNQQFGDDEDIYLTVSSDEESGNESDHSLIILRAKKKQSDSSLVSTTSVSSIVLTEIETSPFASCNSSLESVVFRSKECKLCNLDKLTSHPQCPYNHCLSKSAVVEKGSGAGKKTNQE